VGRGHGQLEGVALVVGDGLAEHNPVGGVADRLRQRRLGVSDVCGCCIPLGCTSSYEPIVLAGLFHRGNRSIDTLASGNQLLIRLVNLKTNGVSDRVG
jgi:hypothetical protein